MIYTDEADFRQDTKWQDIAPWVTPFSPFALALKLLSADLSQILHDASKEFLSTRKFPIYS